MPRKATGPVVDIGEIATRFAARNGRKLTADQMISVNRKLSQVAPGVVQAFKAAAMAAFKPHPGPQTAFVDDEETFEVLYGGAAGGGKSEALVGLMMRRCAIPNHSGVLFRKTYAQIDGEDGLLSKTLRMYPATGMSYSGGNREWVSPAEGRVVLRHLADTRAHLNYQGQAFQTIGFDELTQYTESEYLYLTSRARSTDPNVKSIVRATANPGGPGHYWVLERWGPWLDPNHPQPAKAGEVRYFLRGADGKEIQVPEGTPLARGRTFIPAKLADNPSLNQNDEYLATLNALPELDRLRLLHGDWTAVLGEGMYFKREYFNVLDDPAYFAYVEEDPVTQRMRIWDRAATEQSQSNRDPDWTVGMLVAKTKNERLIIEDIIRFRKGPHEVEQQILLAAETDKIRFGRVQTVITQDPGQAGVFERVQYEKALAGFPTRFVLERNYGDKEVRSRPAASAAQARKIDVVQAEWNNAFFMEAEAFPLGVHDDQIDPLSLAVLLMLPQPKKVYDTGSYTINFDNLPEEYITEMSNYVSSD